MMVTHHPKPSRGKCITDLEFCTKTLFTKERPGDNCRGWSAKIYKIWKSKQTWSLTLAQSSLSNKNFFWKFWKMFLILENLINMFTFACVGPYMVMMTFELYKTLYNGSNLLEIYFLQFLDFCSLLFFPIRNLFWKYWKTW